MTIVTSKCVESQPPPPNYLPDYEPLATEIVTALSYEFAYRAEVYGNVLARDNIISLCLGGKITPTEAFSALDEQRLLGDDYELFMIYVAGIRALTVQRQIEERSDDEILQAESQPDTIQALARRD